MAKGVKPVRRAKKKELPHYQFTVIIEPDEGVFHAYVPALPGCHKFGSTLDEARENIAEAIQLHIECMKEDGEPTINIGMLQN